MKDELMLQDQVRRRRQEADDIRFQNAMRADLGMPPLEQPKVEPVEVMLVPPQRRRPAKPRPVVEVVTSSDEFWPADPIRWRVIVREVAAKHRLSVPHLLCERRDAQIVAARNEAFFRMRTELTMSLPAIGRRFNKDHTTVLHGIRRHVELNGLGRGSYA